MYSRSFASWFLEIARLSNRVAGSFYEEVVCDYMQVLCAYDKLVHVGVSKECVTQSMETVFGNLFRPP